MDKKRPSFPVTAIATALGAGLLPYAPGTYGTLMALPLAWWLLGFPSRIPLLVATSVIIVLGIWAAGRYCEATGTKDNQQIVIDEVAGYLVTLLLVERSLLSLGLGFALFRLFDIWKPWPVSVLDRRVGGGLGVMVDDLAAGAIAACVLALLLRLPWPQAFLWGHP